MVEGGVVYASADRMGYGYCDRCAEGRDGLTRYTPEREETCEPCRAPLHPTSDDGGA